MSSDQRILKLGVWSYGHFIRFTHGTHWVVGWKVWQEAAKKNVCTCWDPNCGRPESSQSFNGIHIIFRKGLYKCSVFVQSFTKMLVARIGYAGLLFSLNVYPRTTKKKSCIQFKYVPCLHISAAWWQRAATYAITVRGAANSLPLHRMKFVAVIEHAGNFNSCDCHNFFALENNDKYLLLRYIVMY
jgi:hypothetical protein